MKEAMGRQTTEERAHAGEGPGRDEAQAKLLRSGASDAKSTVHAGALRHLLSVLEGAGLDPRRLLDEAGAGAVDLSDPDQRISVDCYGELWRIAAPRLSSRCPMAPAPRRPDGCSTG